MSGFSRELARVSGEIWETLGRRHLVPTPLGLLTHCLGLTQPETRKDRQVGHRFVR